MKTQISIIKLLAITMTLAALLVATSVQAQETEKSLYERLGGVFAIALEMTTFRSREIT